MKVCSYQDRLNELLDADPRSFTSIANELGVTKQAVSMWRAGTRSPKKDVLLKIAQMYDVSIDWLMGFDVDRKPPKDRVIIIKDADLFNRALQYMDQEDYNRVIDAYEKALRRMKEQGVIE